MSQVRIEDVSKTYIVGGERLTAVARASLEIEKGEFLSIVGHSGSGKTTLLSIIGGMLAPTTGRVLFDDQDIYAMSGDGLSEYRGTKVGFMFQFASLLPVLTVTENLLLPVLFAPDGRSRMQEKEAKAVELLRMVGLSDKAGSYPAQLSGGQQRRVAIARAFMNDPALILADEPTGDLDEETEAEMMRFFQAMNKEKAVTFIMVTHNTELARQAGRRLRMSRGVIEES